MKPWQPHGVSKTGLIQTKSHGQSQTAPAVVAHCGRLWCMWSDLNGDIWYTFTSDDDEGEFLPRKAFPTSGVPVMATLDGHLHAAVVLNSGGIAHFLFDDEEEMDWFFLGLIQVDSSASPFQVPYSSPCLIAFQNRLVLAFLYRGVLYYAFWDSPEFEQSSSSSCPSETWSHPVSVSRSSQTFSGTPALFILDHVLHLLCATNPDKEELLCYYYDTTNSVWVESSDVSGGRAARGVSATNYGDATYLGFMENGSRDQGHNMYITSYRDSKWEPQEPVAGQSAADPPQIAVLNGRIHCIFNDNTSTKDLRWYSRPILEYHLSSWMGDIPGDIFLSQLTIPGTHDSCARSNIPYVRTQYLSVKQQLALGIRFLDLRLRRHDNGELFVYHGGVPIGFSVRLSFKAVMDDVWTFLRGPGGIDSPTETVLISIDNDDTSPEQKRAPEIFYQAVQSAITDTLPYPDNSPRWYTKTVTPHLDEVRGRAVLLRRYKGDPNIAPIARQGLDLSAWVNDSPDFIIITPMKERFHLQDKWRFTERMSLEDLIAAKSVFVQNMMTKAATGPSALAPAPGLGETDPNSQWERQRRQGRNNAIAKRAKRIPNTHNHVEEYKDETEQENDWYINFCSAVGDPTEHGEVAQAKWVAVGARSTWVGGKWVTGMNKITREFVQQQQDELLHDAIGGSQKYRLGVVNLDYPELPTDNDIVSRLIDLNFLDSTG